MENLSEIIKRHQDWLDKKPTGVKANLSNADLRGVLLFDVDLSYANLTDANLKGAKLVGANLKSANLQYAMLSNADLTEADMTYADTYACYLDGAKLKGTKGLEK